jgi:hypothetical protein
MDGDTQICCDICLKAVRRPLVNFIKHILAVFFICYKVQIFIRANVKVLKKHIFPNFVHEFISGRGQDYVV